MDSVASVPRASEPMTRFAPAISSVIDDMVPGEPDLDLWAWWRSPVVGLAHPRGAIVAPHSALDRPCGPLSVGDGVEFLVGGPLLTGRVDAFPLRHHFAC